MSIKNCRPLTICLDARLRNGESGGTQQVIIGLAKSLGELTGPEKYLFLVTRGDHDWLLPYLGDNCTPLFTAGSGQSQPSLPARLLRTVCFQYLWQNLSPIMGGLTVRIPRSDGLIENVHADVMHFTLQEAFLTMVPSIYHPYDLQHLHLPEFFTPRARLVRNIRYQAFCRQADTVIAMSEWGKRDLVSHYHLSPDKVQVVLSAPLLPAYAQASPDLAASVRRKFGLPDTFIFYPAQTWRHKNHILLLRALKSIRDRHGIVIPLVCSGHKNEFFGSLEREVLKLRLSDSTYFLGFVEPLEIQCLYQLCRALIFPSKFEGWGLPIMEAFYAGVPVGCSNVTCLPAQVQDAALIFNPNNIDDIAQVIWRLWTDPELREGLIKRGKERVQLFSWGKAALIFRAHYRRIGKRSLTEEDQFLLTDPPLV